MFLENEFTELKVDLNKDIKKEIVALANSKGGTIYIGVADNGEVVGLDNINKKIEDLSNMIRDGIKTDLTLYTNISTEKIDNKQIIVLKVMSGPNKPYYLTDACLKPSGVYIRHGSVSAPTSDELIKESIKNNHDSFEEQISSNQDLNFDTFNKCFKDKNSSFDESKYKLLNIKNTDNLFTNLGLLLSDECPFTIKCAIFNGNDKLEFKDRKEFTGSLLMQLEDVLKYMNLVNRTSSSFVNYKRVDVRDYPDYAVREALLNAIIHRSYNLNGSILISVFDNRIEITSLGGLLSGISIDDILSGVSLPRNKNLANIFYRLDFVESFGTGIGRIIDSYKDSNYKPVFTCTDNTFKVILPNVNYIEKSPQKISYLSQEDKIINYIKESSYVKRETVDRLLDVSSTRSKKILKNMCDNNLIIKEGNGKNTYYILK